MESLRYVADYYSKSPEKDLIKAKFYFEEILKVEPNDATAKKALGIKDPAPATTTAPGTPVKPAGAPKN